MFGRGHAVLHDFLARLHLATERRDFDDLGSELDVGEAEAAADDPAVPKQLLDLIGMCGGPDVEILRPTSEEQIPHAAADEVGDVIPLSQPVQNLERVRITIGTRQGVLGAGYHPWFGHRRALYQTRHGWPINL